MTVELQNQQIMKVEPVTLEGRWVRLEPLAPHHAAGLAEVSGYPEIWQYMPTPLMTRSQIDAWLQDTLALQATGAVLPFATIDRSTGKPIGSTRYLSIMPKDRGLEIGWTWLTPAVWRTAVNSECKYLLLQHAFEKLEAIRVQIKTHKLNERSRNAILRLGAQYEGILRNQMILPNGTYRDTAFYSIIDSEWPAIKSRMQANLYGE